MKTKTDAIAALLEILERADRRDATILAETLYNNGYRDGKDLINEIWTMISVERGTNARWLMNRGDLPNIIPAEDPTYCYCQGKVAALDNVINMLNEVRNK